VAAKPTQSQHTETRNAVVLFARFRGEGNRSISVPSWSGNILDPDLPGSLSHFYDTMSFGRLHIRGEAAPRWYESEHEVAFYLSGDPGEKGHFGEFALEILMQADRDIDFSRFDNDGPDGMPDSGDDDGIVDAVAVLVHSVPRNFLLGPATGIASLGLHEPYDTGDPGSSGEWIRIAGAGGIVVQARTFSEAVGSACHEFGHLLGLRDLYNTAFLRSEEPLGPKEDSAGIGAWGLMGWGALGWHGDDGPNSFCAHSRLQLGWSEVTEVEEERQDIALADVGKTGAVHRIRMSGGDFLLLEYRRREGNYYDRSIPSEGLLIWHVERKPRFKVDLECADGRWREGGFPLGITPASREGGDNLDFWAHDQDYALAHGGNLGDATDAYDGVRFRSFGPHTNPDSYSSDGRLSPRIEDIRLEDGTVRAQVTLDPPRLLLERMEVVDDNDDGVLIPGETAIVWFRVVNQGGVMARGVRAEVSSRHPRIEVIQPRVALGDLHISGRTQGTPAAIETFPRIVLGSEAVGAGTSPLRVSLYAGDRLLDVADIAVETASHRQVVVGYATIDTAGNGNGVPQPGEFISIDVTLAVDRTDALGPLDISLSALDSRVLRLGIGRLAFEQRDSASAHTISGPEFLLPAELSGGERLDFELRVDAGPWTWRDTLTVHVAEGGDETPPRISYVRAQMAPEGLRVSVEDRWIVDARPIRSARAVLYTVADTAELSSVSLKRDQDGYFGVWEQPPPGRYLILAEIMDEAENLGRSRLMRTVVLPERTYSPELFVDTGPWEKVTLPAMASEGSVTDVAVAPSAPSVWYASTTDGVWRSEDEGGTWQRTGLMLNGTLSYPQIIVDAADPFAILVDDGGRAVVSRDGGNEWSAIGVPSAGLELTRIVLDRVVPGRILAHSGSRLWCSEDQGTTWRETRMSDRVAGVWTHAADPRTLYATTVQYERSSETTMAAVEIVETGVWQSADGGHTWRKVVPRISVTSMQPDPSDASSLFGLDGHSLWHSPDGGGSWAKRSDLPGDATQLSVSTTAPAVLHSWGFGSSVWVSKDGGRTWTQLRDVTGVLRLVPRPDDPGRVLVVAQGDAAPGMGFLRGGKLLECGDGAPQREVVISEQNVPVGAVVFTSDGRHLVAAQRRDTEGGIARGVFVRQLEEEIWGWQEAPISWLDTVFDVVHVDPYQPDIMIVHGSNGLGNYLRSSDGGRTWETMRVPSGGTVSFFGSNVVLHPELLAHPLWEGLCYLADQQVYRSEDFGETWQVRTPVKRGVSAMMGFNQLGGLALDPADPDAVYTAMGDSVWHTDDGGMTWEVTGRVARQEGIFDLAFHPTATGRVLAVTTGGFYVSDDEGDSWVRTLAAEPSSWVTGRIRLGSGSPDHLLLVTSRSLHESTDGGSTWMEVGGGFGGMPWYHDAAIDPLDPSVIYAATTWGLHRLDRSAEPTAIGDDGSGLPWELVLYPNYPNPFNVGTVIRFSLPAAGRTTVSVHSLIGQSIRTLLEGDRGFGRHVIYWDGRDDNGRLAASGVYVCRLTAGNEAKTRKLLVLR